MKIGIITKEKQHFILSLSSTTTLLVRSPVHFRPVRCVVAVAFVKGVHAVTFLFTFSFRVNLQKFIYTFRVFSPHLFCFRIVNDPRNSSRRIYFCPVYRAFPCAPKKTKKKKIDSMRK